jgi:RimJ/RimL family protein N-acetyltransferase
MFLPLKNRKKLMSSYEIRRCNIDDLEAYSKHCIFHLTEKGIGDIFVHPFPANHKSDPKEFETNIRKRWMSQPFSPNWEIAWVAITNNKIVGHLNLRCGGIEAQTHRMKLGMGIENGFRSNGIGSSILGVALDWAKEQDQISWIDLSVFSKNVAARKLYKKFGFTETHIIEDALRIEGERIDDVQMNLKFQPLFN